MIYTEKEIQKAFRFELKTAYIPQARISKVGLDCAGLPAVVFSKLGFEIFDYTNYHIAPFEGKFIEMVEKNCDLVKFEDLKVGDMLTFGFNNEAQHIAVVLEVKPRVSIIHALSRNKCVSEHDLDGAWLRQLKRCYRLKDLEIRSN